MIAEGQLTIHEESLALLEALSIPDGAISQRNLIKYVQRVARATMPPSDPKNSITVEPIGKTPWDWIAGKNLALMMAAGHEGTSGAIMALLRGMEVWAHDHGTTLEYADVGRTIWTDDGRLIIEFKTGEGF